jgi:sugar/nucleoside kinase (ribokinase family)
MSRILSFGSLNIDYVYSVDHFVQKGETLSSDGMHVSSGGKGLNQSCALGKAGCQVYHAGIIGKDGTFLLDVLKQARVDTPLSGHRMKYRPETPSFKMIRKGIIVSYCMAAQIRR